MISLSLPSDPSEVVAIGKLAIRHGQLDYGLKLTIRSVRGTVVTAFGNPPKCVNPLDHVSGIAGAYPMALADSSAQ